MTINKHTNGDLIDADETNQDNAQSINFSILNKVRQTIDRTSVDSAGQDDIFSEAYIDATGQNNFVTTAMSATSAVFDTNKYKTIDLTNVNSYIIIEADDDTTLSWNSNNCKLYRYTTGKYLIYSSSNNLEVERAEVYKSLFFGTNGTNQLIDLFTNITAIKTNTTRDVGSRASYIKCYTSVTAGASSTTSTTDYVGTFSDTTTNTDFSSWSNGNTWSGTGTGYAQWESPSGTILSGGAGSAGIYTEIGLDKTLDELSNPTNCKLYTRGVDNTSSGATGGDCRVIMIHKGTINWVATETEATGTTVFDNTDRDFITDGTIPVFTTADTLSNEGIITAGSLIYHTIPSGTYPSNVSKLIGKSFYEDWEEGATTQHRLENATENSGWINDGELGEFTAFTSEPTKYIVRLTPKTSSPTVGYPSIRGTGMYTE